MSAKLEASGWRLDMGDEGKRQPIRSYRDLEVHQRAREIRNRIHKIVLSFPDYERFDLVDQMRRASKSVPTNIGEGFAHRDTPAKLKHAMGSANEMETHLETASDLGYVSERDYAEALAEYPVIGRQLNRLITTWQHFKRPASSVQRPASATPRARSQGAR